jgi:hypothetical protein
VAAAAHDPRLAFDVFAVVAPSGAPLAAIDLDGAGRVRTGVFFYTSREEADAGRAAAAATSPAAKGCVVVAVPFGDALGLVYTPPYKIAGLPGYYCFRFYTGPATATAAKQLSGLDNLSDLGLPVFYAEEVASPAAAKTSDLYLLPGDAARAAKPLGAAGRVAVADLGRVARSWAEAEAASAVPLGRSTPRVVPPDRATARASSGRAPAFKPAERVLALEWNVYE